MTFSEVTCLSSRGRGHKSMSFFTYVFVVPLVPLGLRILEASDSVLLVLLRRRATVYSSNDLPNQEVLGKDVPTVVRRAFASNHSVDTLIDSGQNVHAACDMVQLRTVEVDVSAALVSV